MKTLKVNSYSLYQWEGWHYIVYIMGDDNSDYTQTLLDEINSGNRRSLSVKARLIKILATPSQFICTYEGNIGSFSTCTLSTCFDTFEEALAEYLLEKL